MPRPPGGLSPEIVVVVLAAGEGRRLGLGPKAHVLLGGEALLARVVRSCREAGLTRAWVVGSPGDIRITAACDALAVEVVINPQPELGMASSVHVGLREAQRQRAGGALVFPVDHPLVRASTIARLADALQDDAWVRPLHARRRGHPIALGAALVSRLLALDPRTPLREALEAAGARGVDVPCDDPATLEGVNTPADLERATMVMRTWE